MTRAKLTDSQVIEILTRYASGTTQTQLGKDYGINQVTVFSIVRNKTWKHIDRSGLPTIPQLKRKVTTERHGHHGLEGNTYSRTYSSWKAMIQRCENPNSPNFRWYGGRGIVICDRWRNSFVAFLADMGERPQGLSLDRYPNPDGNYEPGNCRWATKEEQTETMRKHCSSQYEGVTKARHGQWAAHFYRDGKRAAPMTRSWPPLVRGTPR